MAGPPIWRRWTRAAPGALDVFALATDDVTTLGFYTLSQRNDILDMLNDPDPAAGLRYEIDILKNGIPTGRNFFTTAMSSASAGRGAIGPLGVGAGNINFSVAQRAGALTATSFIVKFATA